MTPAIASRLYTDLRDHLTIECRKHGIAGDVYDADFILGTLMEWLGEHNVALMESGVRTIRSYR